jgi:hypothetical protein
MASRFNVSTVFSALDRMTAPLRTMTNGIRRFESQVLNANNRVNGFGNNSSIGRLNTRIQALRRNFTGLAGDIGHAAGKLSKMAMPGFGTLAVGAAAGYAGLKILDTASEHEDAELTLSTMYGGHKQGHERANFLQEMAKKLPYEFKDYLDADVVMKDVGKTANSEEFKGLASIASAKGIDFNNFVRDMRGMDTEGLKTILGASSMPKTEKGVLSLNDLNGKRISFTKDEAGISKFYTWMAKWGNKKYPGLADERGNTYSGLTATASDTVKQVFTEAVNSSGWFDFAKNFVREFTSQMELISPKMKLLFNALYSKLANTKLLSKIGTVFESAFSRSLDKITTWIAGIDESKIAAFGVWIETLPTKIELAFNGFSKFASDTLPKLVTGLEAVATVVQAIADSIKVLNGWGTTIGGALFEYNQAKFGAKWDDKSTIPYVAPPASTSSINPQQTAMDVVMGKSSTSVPEKSSLEVNINTITGQTTTTSTGTGIKKPVVNTGNNSQRAQNKRGASLTGAW